MPFSIYGIQIRTFRRLVLCRVMMVCMMQKDKKLCAFVKNMVIGAGLIGILSFGLVLDLTYSGKVQRKLFVDIFEWLVVTLSPLGARYHVAREILKSNLGVLVTMVSLLLTMNINVSERAEKKVYGISRDELNFSRYKTLYSWIRGITYTAPIFMLISINLGYCLFGYLLLLFCYAFLILHHWLYNQSYDQAAVQKSVVHMLMCYSDRGIDEEKEELLDYLSVLENIGNSIEADNNWKKAQQLYNCLMMEAAKKREIDSACLLCYYFFREVFWKRKQLTAMHVIQHTLREMDMLISEEVDEYGMKMREAILWGMLEIGIVHSTEEDLVMLLEELLYIAERSGRTVRNYGKELPVDAFQNQIGGILALIEFRLDEKEMQHSKALARKIGDAISYCETILINKEEFWEEILYFTDLLPKSESRKAKEAISNLRDDFIYDRTRSAIKTILRLMEETG